MVGKGFQGTNTPYPVRVTFQTRKLQKTCSSLPAMRQKWGDQRARKVAQRLQELEAARSLDDMRLLPAARCHELKGDRQGQLAMEIHSGFRLVFEPDHNPVPLHVDGGLDWTMVDTVIVIEVVNYHG